jgi:hypothetical protein
VITTNHIFPISQKHWGQYEEERNVRLSLTSLMNISLTRKQEKKKEKKMLGLTNAAPFDSSAM